MALAEPLAPDPADVDHPNGAVGLVGVILCVPDADIARYEARYERYLQRPARASGTDRAFDLGGCVLVLVPDSGLGALLPGEIAPALPAFVGYVVAVRDGVDTARFPATAGIPTRSTPTGDLFVPASDALGAAVVFRAAKG